MLTYFQRPFNSGQAHAPNWYNLNYRRSGTYKGMGQVFSLSDQIAPSTSNLETGVSATGIIQTAYDPYAPMYAASDFVPAGSSIAMAPAGGTATSYLPWIVAGGLLLILLARRR